MAHKIAPVDPSKLFKVEIYSDGIAGEILAHIPVLASGGFDFVRLPFFMGKTRINFPGNPPIDAQFKLEGSSLDEAIKNWSSAVSAAIEEIRTEAFKQAILTKSS